MAQKDTHVHGVWGSYPTWKRSRDEAILNERISRYHLAARIERYLRIRKIYTWRDLAKRGVENLSSPKAIAYLKDFIKGQKVNHDISIAVM